MLRAQASAVVVADAVGAPLPAADPQTGEVETVDGELVDDDNPLAYSELSDAERAGATA
jgi:hypothetical protein